MARAQLERYPTLRWVDGTADALPKHGWIFGPAIRKSAPSADWWSVESVMPKITGCVAASHSMNTSKPIVSIAASAGSSSP